MALTGKEMLVGGERHLLVFRGNHHLFVVNSITNTVVHRMRIPHTHTGHQSLVDLALEQYERSRSQSKN